MDRHRLLKIFATAAAFVIIGVVSWHFIKSERQAGDLIAFYCGGRAVLQHANPYLAEPLTSCERPISQGFASGTTLPNVLPGYVLAGFAALARLPFTAVAAVYLAIVILALGVQCFALGALLERSPLFAFLALAPLAYVCINLGQMLPIVCGSALTIAALLLRRKRYWQSGLACCLAAVEPHIALPVLLAMLVWVPRARLAVMAGVAALIGITIGVLGLHTSVQFVTAILPGQARAEAGYAMQYSVTWLAHIAGLPDARSLLVAVFTSIVSLVLILAAVRMFSRRIEAPEALLLFAPLAGIVGAVFLHITQIIVIIPAALFAVTRFPALRRLSVPTLVLLQVPWLILAFERTSLFSLFTFAAIAAVVAAIEFHDVPLVTAARFGALALVASAGLIVPISRVGIAPPPPMMRSALVSPRELSTDVWRARLHAEGPGLDSRALMAKIPTWLGLLLLLTLIVSAASRTTSRYSGLTSGTESLGKL